MKKYCTTFRLLWLLLFVCSFTKAFSQPTGSDKRQIKKLLKRGNRHFAMEDYHKALAQYEQILEIDSVNTQGLYQAGISRLMLFGSKSALEYLRKYESTLQADNKPDKHFTYWLGRAYHLDSQFEMAAENYNKYLETLSRNDSRQDEVRKLILQTEFGKVYLSNPSDYYATSLGAPLNSRYSDHSPILSRDKQTLIFTSRRTENKQGDEITPKGDSYENVYLSVIENGTWSKPRPMDRNINSRKQHTSNVQLFDNDNKMLVYKSVNFGSLFMSEKEGNSWSKPKKFNKYMNTARFEPNGFVIKDETVVYFASGRESKNGNLDLFVSRRNEDSTWSEPERLPALINTDADEDAPFVSEDGNTLYFSSRGHDSMGGFDVFKATYSPASGTWSKPLNMGYPFSSPADDIYFVTDSTNKLSYVTSNRGGTTGEEDIFAIKAFGNVNVNGLVTDQRSGIPLQDFIINFTAQRKADVKTSLQTNEQGRYNLHLLSNYTYNVEIRNDAGDVLLLDVLNVPMAENDTAVIVRNYQVNLPSDDLALQGQRIKVENLNLVKMQYRPADSLTIRGLVSDPAGVIEDAQVIIRYEDSREALLTTTTDDEGQYVFRFIPGEPKDFVVDVYKDGYLLNSIAVLYNEKIDFQGSTLELKSTMVNSVDASTRMTQIQVGARQVLGGVYFEFNSAKLLAESSIALDKLHQFLKDNPTITMEVGGHTDNIGTPEVNKLISRQRAQSVVNYLVKKGITRRRLKAEGYGETQPITSNETSLNGRDVNRRVEVTILSK